MDNKARLRVGTRWSAMQLSGMQIKWIAKGVGLMVIGSLAIVTVLFITEINFKISNRWIQETDMPVTPSAVTGHLFKAVQYRTFGGKLRFDNFDHQHDSKAFIKRRLSSSSGLIPITSSKWAVCTTVHKVSAAIQYFADALDWAIVVVGDQSMEDTFELSGKKAVYLDAKSQVDILSDYKAFLELLPWRHFGRKNIGYIYAILNGAELIWDFDDDNFIKPGLLPTVPVLIKEVVAPDCPSFNPLPIMGGDDSTTVPMWPRGYPLNSIKKVCNFTFEDGDAFNVAVFQSLADHEPDVDGIYRLTRDIPYTFKSESQTAVKISAGSMVPYNAQATLITKMGLWSLLLPVTVHGRVSDIWRSYISQRIFWDFNLTIAFTPPIVDQMRNLHNALADMQAEQDLYYKTPEMIRHLQKWTSSAITLPQRLEELVVSLYEHGFIEENDVKLYQEWTTILVESGYHFPTSKSVSEIVSESVVVDGDVGISTSALASSRFVPRSSGHALGAWALLFDPSMLPYSWESARAYQPILSHELNLDFAEVLYEWENWMIFVDSVGPVCLTQAFFAANKETALNDEGTEIFMIEIDGKVYLNDTAASIFYTGIPALPRALTRSTVQNSVFDGWYMHCGLCASERIRVGMRWMDTKQTMVEIMRQGEACVSSLQAHIKCPSTMYYNVQLLHLSGPDLPLHWKTPLSSTVSPFNVQDVNSLNLYEGQQFSNLEDALNPLNLIRSLLLSCMDHDQGAKNMYNENQLTSKNITIGHNNSRHIIFEALGSGTIKLVVLNLAGDQDLLLKQQILHSNDLRIQAWWDGGVSMDGRWPKGRSQNCKEICADPLVGPSVDISLAALWGPEKLLDKAIPVHATYLLGETERYGLHLAFPMPFWESACVRLSYTGTAESIQLHTKIVFSLNLEYDRNGRAGYFFVQFTKIVLGPGHQSTNYVVNVSGLQGSLVGMSQLADSTSRFFVEGDLLIWVDKSPTPAVWSSGFEDWYLGSHGYFKRDYYGPYHAYSRADKNESVSTWQTRHLPIDAVPFRDSLLVFLEGEGFDDGNPNTLVETAALIYGWPTRGLHVSDIIVPADEKIGINLHKYMITADHQNPELNESWIEDYALSSYFPGFGFERSQHRVAGRIPAEIFMAVPNILALKKPAAITFTVAIEPENAGVILRRLTDTRRSLSRAEVFVDGISMGMWINSDRSWSHLDCHWQIQDFILTSKFTTGKTFLDVRLKAGPDNMENQTRYDFMFTQAWIEAKWWIITVLPDINLSNF